MKITKKFLKANDACSDGIALFERNFPNGLDTEKVTVEGDFNDHWIWLTDLLKFKFEYDDRGNVIKRTAPNGILWEYKYDDRDNVVKKITPSGGAWHYEYDDRDNMVKKITPSEDVWHYEYDNKGNVIKRTATTGIMWHYEYDDRDNMVKKITPSGDVWRWEYEYDDYDRLISISECGKTLVTIKYHY